MKRTSAGLREFLFDQLEGLADGRTAPEDALAAAKVAETIIKSVEIEIRYRKELIEARKEGSVMQLGELSLAPESAPKPEIPGQPRLIRGKNA